MNKILYYTFLRFTFIILLFYYTDIAKLYAEPGTSVFMYHRFGEEKYPSTNVTKDQFLSHIEYVLNSNITVIKLDQVIEALEENRTFSKKTIAFSVDDAYSSFYDFAWPVFRENNIPVTLFLSTDIIDKKTNGYMTWDEIKKFIDEGGDVGQHTSTHLHMPLNNNSLIEKDILNSHKSFLKNLGFIPKLFAYPYGESSKNVIDLLKEFGISHAFGQHSGVISSYDNPHYLPRFSLNERFGEIDRFEFAANANSLLIEDFVPSEIFLEIEKKPLIEFSIVSDLKNNSVNCFSNPGGKWGLQEIHRVTTNRIQIKLNEEYHSGRARLNCTVNVEDKWLWFGYQFLIK